MPNKNTIQYKTALFIQKDRKMHSVKLLGCTMQKNHPDWSIGAKDMDFSCCGDQIYLQ